MDSEDENKETDNFREELLVKKGKIQIKNLNFAYENINVLENLNITIPEGKKIAIVGLSGSG